MSTVLQQQLLTTGTYHIGPQEPTLLRERFIIDNPNKIYNSKL